MDMESDIIIISDDEDIMDNEVALPDNRITNNLALPILDSMQVDEVNEKSEPEIQPYSPLEEEGSLIEPKVLEEDQKPMCSISISSNRDGIVCPICFVSAPNYGEHRICSLKCGHLFGLSCIKAQKQNVCHICKKKSVISQIRPICATNLAAINTADYEIVKKKLAAVTQVNSNLQVALTRNMDNEHLLLRQVNDLKKQLNN